MRDNQCNIVGWAERSVHRRCAEGIAQHPRWVALRLTQPTKRYFNSSKLMWSSTSSFDGFVFSQNPVETRYIASLQILKINGTDH
jgi:hypothetical protein